MITIVQVCISLIILFSTTFSQDGSTIHTYSLTINDINGKGIESCYVKIKYSVTTDFLGNLDTVLLSSTNGAIILSLNIERDKDIASENLFSSQFEYEVNKQGYYSHSGLLKIRLSKSEKFKVNQITLIKPSDYLKPQFSESKQAIPLKKNILSFIDLIKLESLFSDAILEYQSIDLVEFKNKNYLQIKLSSSNTYNSLKLDQYDIGKILFDEVVRKILNPLNNYIRNPKIFYGYDVTVTSSKKDFSQEYAIAKPLEFRFLMPESAVKNYKDKDISGQQLLDKSIILLNDERIDLKLQ